MDDYQPIPEDQIPAYIIWHTPDRWRGQIVEVSYSTGAPSGRGLNAEADYGDKYCRVIDHSDRSVDYEVWVGPRDGTPEYWEALQRRR